MSKKKAGYRTPLFKFVLAALRRASYRWPPRTEALKAAKVAYGRYKCAACSQVYRRKEIQLDHLLPIISLTGFESWDILIKRLFCDKDGWQVLCAECHKKKTNDENKRRK